MKKSFYIICITLLAVVFTSCNSLSGIEKEKTTDGFIKSHDLVADTIRYEHPALVPDFDVGKYNINGNKQFENIQAYIYEDKFYLEADYGNKGRKYLNLDTIMFFTKRNMIEFSNEDKNLPNTYYKFQDIDGLTYENLKVGLSEENMNLLGRFLVADDVYIAFRGERGRTDLFKVSKKIKRSILAVINKWNKLNDKPIIEEPKPEPKPKAEPKENVEDAETVAAEETVAENTTEESDEVTVEAAEETKEQAAEETKLEEKTAE